MARSGYPWARSTVSPRLRTPSIWPSAGAAVVRSYCACELDASGRSSSKTESGERAFLGAIGPKNARSPSPPLGWLDVEAEHHPGLVVFGDVAVGHPAARVRDLEQDVDGLPGADQHRVLPDQVRLRLAVPREDEETAGTVHVEGVVHRVVARHLVEQPDLHPVADAELPGDGIVLGVGIAVDQLPAHVGRRGEPVDLDHVVLPFDAVRARVVMRVLPPAVVLPVLGVFAGLLTVAVVVSGAGGSNQL